MIDTTSLRNIPIQNYLESKGFQPTAYRSGRFWYHSPLREGDQTPSFVVNESSNRWYDFGEGRGGSIIDLALCLERGLSYLEVLKLLNDFSGQPAIHIPQIKNQPGEKVSTDKGFRLDELVPLHRSYKLSTYLQSRGIDPTLAARHGVQVAYYYTPNHYKRFALAFKNDAGGYELRNPDLKGTLGHKSISTFSGTDPHRAIVLEGFMDYLSFRQLHPDYPGKIVVLNSTALVEKAVTPLVSCREVRLFLDNDPAGDNATQRLMELLTQASPTCGCVDSRAEYAGYNDLNDYLRRKLPLSIPPTHRLSPPIQKPKLKL